MKSTLLIGVGNQFREDDSVGLQVARRIARLKIPSLVVREESGEGASLMEAWEGFDRVYLVDAVQDANEPGKIYRFEAKDEKLPSRFFNYSTHAFSVAEAIEMSRALGRLPSRLIVYGIEGESFMTGQTLSPPVSAARDTLVQELAEIFTIGGSHA